MSVTPLSSQSAQPILVPQSIKRNDASIEQGAAVSEKPKRTMTRHKRHPSPHHLLHLTLTLMVLI